MSLAWALSPDPGQARQWLEDELSRRDYQESLLERFGRWFDDLVGKVREASGQVGVMNPVLAIVLLVVFVAVIAFALSRLRRNVAAPNQAGAVLVDARLSAEQHRRSAREALQQARWEDAVVESVRALAAGLVERGLLPEQADLTVHELTERAAALYPSLAERLRHTGVAFDETRYGDRPADEQRAREAVDLELETSRRAPETGGTRTPVPAVPR